MTPKNKQIAEEILSDCRPTVIAEAHNLHRSRGGQIIRDYCQRFFFTEEWDRIKHSTRLICYEVNRIREVQQRAKSREIEKGVVN